MNCQPDNSYDNEWFKSHVGGAVFSPNLSHLGVKAKPAKAESTLAPVTGLGCMCQTLLPKLPEKPFKQPKQSHTAEGQEKISNDRSQENHPKRRIWSICRVIVVDRHCKPKKTEEERPKDECNEKQVP